MEWEFDETRSAYTLDAAPYRVVAWREPKGEWSVRIDGPDGPRIQHSFAYWEDARVWSERELAKLGSSAS